MKGLGKVIDVVRALVASLGQDITVTKSLILSPTEQKLWVDKTLWMRAAVDNAAATEVTVGGTGYQVQQVEECEYIIVTTDEDADLIVPGPATIPAPTFIHGTVVSAQDEIQQLTRVENNLSTRLPLVYMVEQFSGEENYEKGKVLGINADLRLFFLDTCSKDSWLTATHWTRVIDPMNRVQIEFMEKLKKHPSVLHSLVTSGRITGHARVGTYDSKRQTADLFNFPLSGIEWRGNAPLIKQCC